MSGRVSLAPAERSNLAPRSLAALLALGRRRMFGHAEALVEIGADRRDEIVDAILEEMVRAFDDGVLDDDAFLRLQLLDQALHLLRRRDPVAIAVNE